MRRCSHAGGVGLRPRRPRVAVRAHVRRSSQAKRVSEALFTDERCSRAHVRAAWRVGVALFTGARRCSQNCGAVRRRGGVGAAATRGLHRRADGKNLNIRWGWAPAKLLARGPQPHQNGLYPRPQSPWDEGSCRPEPHPASSGTVCRRLLLHPKGQWWALHQKTTVGAALRRTGVAPPRAGWSRREQGV
eukprot:scaffold342_cov106-Isochrysis_galbana.AAC.2